MRKPKFAEETSANIFADMRGWILGCSGYSLIFTQPRLGISKI